jgi:hypothetical protein
LFSPGEARAVLTALAEAPLSRTKAGARHVLRIRAVHEMAYDSRLTTLAKLFVGESATPFRATLFDKSPEANWLVAWHQDTALPLATRIGDPEWGPWSTKGGVLYAHAPAWALERVIALRVSLDDSTTSNGPLRVLPDTHLLGVLSDAETAQLARDRTAVECLAAAGGVIVMRPLTVHASSKSADHRPRRVLHIEYAGSELGARIPLAVE